MKNNEQPERPGTIPIPKGYRMGTEAYISLRHDVDDYRWIIYEKNIEFKTISMFEGELRQSINQSLNRRWLYG